jgi:hypothetical protein
MPKAQTLWGGAYGRFICPWLVFLRNLWSAERATGLFGEKYRIHPIYSICLFRNVRINILYGGVVHIRRPLKHLLSGHAMSDLVLQYFRDAFSEDLAQALSHEKTKMFGDHKVPAKKRGVNHLFPNSITVAFTIVRKKLTQCSLKRSTFDPQRSGK